MPQDENDKSTIQSIPAADFKAEAGDQIGTTTRTYPVKQPEKDKNDFLVQVLASTLHRCRSKLSEIKQASSPYGEILLAVSTLFLGAIIGAWLAGITMKERSAIFFYVISPAIAVGGLVAYFFCRHISITDPSKTASEVLNELPDPDKTIDTGAKN